MSGRTALVVGGTPASGWQRPGCCGMPAPPSASQGAARSASTASHPATPILAQSTYSEGAVFSGRRRCFAVR